MDSSIEIDQSNDHIVFNGMNLNESNNDSDDVCRKLNTTSMITVFSIHMCHPCIIKIGNNLSQEKFLHFLSTSWKRRRC
jgi:hypothetical protein